MVLIKSLLQNLLVFWLTLEKVLLEVKHNVRHIISSLLWKGPRNNLGFHLVSWDMISKPKVLGGCGFWNIHWFSQALEVKSLWRGLFGLGSWSKVMVKKYLKGEDVILWLHAKKYKFTAPSNFWRNFMDTMPLLKKYLTFLVGNRDWVLIG